MDPNIEALKASLNGILDSLENTMAALQSALENSQSAAGGIHMTIEGTGRTDLMDVAAIAQEVSDSIAEDIDKTAIMMEQIRTYYAML